MKFEELKENVEKWGYDKNLIYSDYRFRQFEKVLEEVFELKEEIIQDNKENMKLEFGDVIVTLIILSKQLDIDFEECLELAYLKIKNRQGKTIDGQFIKQEDL
jgi:NTP pyrophosphatase (non-canonical NTP hydrolase)